MSTPVPMARTPEDLHAVIEDAFNRGDLDAFIAAHEADATVAVPPDGHPAHGLDAIRAATAPIFALRPHMTSTVHRKLQTGDLALTQARWELTGTAGDGSAVHLSGHGTIVSRRRPEGTWGIVLDHPLSAIRERGLTTPSQATQSGSTPAMARLAALAGEWTQEIGVTGVPAGRTVFEWMLGGSFLLQRNEIPHPDFPDSILIIAADPSGETYTQHYFDSRGVARIYKMTFGEGKWTLLRDAEDFTPLDAKQRFTGTFEDDNTIDGAWEHSQDGVTWKRDFSLSFKKIG